jgi:drug/metabolite transporter (DMT)-like permease
MDHRKPGRFSAGRMVPKSLVNNHQPPVCAFSVYPFGKEQQFMLDQEQRMIRGVSTQQATLYAIFVSGAFNAGGQLLFKAARFGHANAPMLAMFTRVETWAGFLAYGLSSIMWLWVLSRAQLSYAYPILALTFPIVVGMSALLFGESISLLRWMGVGLILCGVSLLART